MPDITPDFVLIISIFIIISVNSRNLKLWAQCPIMLENRGPGLKVAARSPRKEELH